MMGYIMIKYMFETILTWNLKIQTTNKINSIN